MIASIATVVVVTTAAILGAVLNPASTTDSTEPTPGAQSVSVEQITVSAEKTEIYIGDSLQLQAAVLPENADNKDVVWSILTGAELATISDTGLLSAMAPGQVMVRAEAKDGSNVYGEYMLDIYQLPSVYVQSITLSGDKDNVDMGQQLAIRAEVLPADADNKGLRWEVTSGAEFAEIDGSGVLTGKAAGNVTVRATAEDGSGVYGELTVKVNPAPVTNVTSITISGAKDIKVGDSLQLTAAVKPDNATNKGVTWSISSGSSYATISDSGKLTAKAAGTVKVKATAKDGSGVYGELTVKVNPAPVTNVTSITISGAKDIKVGDSLQLTAAVKPDNATNKGVTWSISSGSSYATISDSGKLTAKAAGTVKVKATAKDGSGKSAEVTVKIAANTVSVTSVSVSAGNATIYVGDSLQLTATVKPDNATNKAVSWSISSGSSCATISDSGMLTATAAGTVKVKATAKDGSGKSGTVTITVKAKALWEGSGTQNDPFLIRNLTDLKNLQKVVDKAGYYYRQVADIDCASVGNWIVIGDEEHPFRHHIDGGGYKISNLCFDGDATALFQRVEDSHFKNMNIVNAHSKDNHRTEENRTDKLPVGGKATGAIVGYGSGCSFENCTATVNFQSSNSTTGGLIGAVELKNEKYVLMNNCRVTGTITSGGFAGGLIGNISTYLSDGDYKPAETITVENCSADVNIKIFTTSTEAPCVGGLIGKSFGVLVEKCHTAGTIHVIDGDIGGLIGDAGNYTDVTRCYSEMDIYISSDDHYGGVSAGGLIGHIYSRSDVHDCYATGNITAPYIEWSPCQDSTNKNGGPWRRYYNPCGSLIGTLEVFKAYSEDEKITIYNCYATGKVNVPNICEDKRVYCHGALIGLVLDRQTVISYNIKDTTKKDLTSWDDFKEYYIGHFGNNYNLEDLRNYYEPINEYQYSGLYGLQNPKYDTLPKHQYVEIITESELTRQATFEGWDFVNIWQMTANGPTLR